jgi:3-(3-hydroxy-phenyl)propionate hydroxylase
MYFHQPVFDRTLREAVGALDSVTIRLSTEVNGLDEGADSVTVRVQQRGRGAEEVKVRWLVGCDGASSVTRESLGIELDSFDFEEKWLICDFLLHSSSPPALGAVQVCDPARPRTELPMPGNRFRLEFKLMPGEVADRLLASSGAIQEILGRQIDLSTADVVRTAIYTILGLVAHPWRIGRVLIAGDAAHLMPPFLGQGMCSGMRDAANLAWKLDHVIRNSAPPELLDTYEVERRPHVRHVIRSAVELGRLICLSDPLAAADRDQRLLNSTNPTDDRFRFTLPPLARGPLVVDGGGELFAQPPATGPLRFDDWVGQRFFIVGCDQDVLGTSALWWGSRMGALVATVGDVPPDNDWVKKWMAQRTAAVVVVRPDRYVLGAGNDLDDITSAVKPWLATAVDQWHAGGA